jgi:hypothetical protein
MASQNLRHLTTDALEARSQELVASIPALRREGKRAEALTQWREFNTIQVELSFRLANGIV